MLEELIQTLNLNLQELNAQLKTLNSTLSNSTTPKFKHITEEEIKPLLKEDLKTLTPKPSKVKLKETEAENNPFPKPSKIKLENSKLQTTLKETEAENTPLNPEAQGGYEKTRLLIKELAPTHREQIKLLNSKHKLSKFADILNDPENPDAGVKDEKKLKLYYSELLKLKDE